MNPANGDAIFTVPNGKTFVGDIYIQCSTGTLGVSAATGGTQATGTGAFVDTVPVSIAGTVGGNAVTVIVAGGGIGRILVAGYIK